jgi:hypothetical protein
MSAAAAVIPVTAVAVTAGVARSSTQTTPYSLSGLPAQSRQPSVASLPITAGPRFATTQHTAASLSVGANVDMIGSSDVVQQSVINGTNVFTCNPGKDTAQNETTIASQGSTLIGGANDCRLYEPSENRYDGSGGFYRSTNSGSTWHAGFLPGLVRANTGAPGPYESAGDPAVASGPNGTFWYANLAFNRSDAANSVAVSRSTNGGKTWLTHFVIQTSAQQGTVLSTTRSGWQPIRATPAGTPRM